ncbi:MAG: right-handed parallel beta-helix repeat-containing protein [Candidatus Cloacimonetes bacterium]|nr:right-handed parallel beta-helix repeat-containing protein [Candidatus Cloacimonadota bacterium]
MKTLLLIFILLFTNFLYSTIINIPADQPTIQEGINVAVDGDTILVADGIYTGDLNKNLTWNGIEKHLIVRSENGPDNCVIDCENDGRAFCFNQTNQDTTDVIEGFTIMNGSAEFGGAIIIQYSNPKIINCIFEDNHSNNWENCKGGALYIISCNGLIIENCRFDDNSSVSEWGSYGGAIYILGSDITLIYCIFINNTANSMEVPAYGGAFFSGYSNIEVTNCTFYSNNASSMYGAYGGAIFYYNSNAISKNSIYWRNMSGAFLEIQIETEDSQLTIEYCDIENNIFTGIGNIDLNPLFENPENGNLNLLPSSPCIDAGDPNPIYYDPDGTVNDMGALYYDQSSGLPYTGPVWYVAPFGNNENEGSFEFPFQTIQRGIMFAADGDTVIVMDGIYCGFGNKDLDFDGKSITVKSENGAEDTIIDCEQAGRGFYFHLDEDFTSVLDGFIITNGYAYCGGGLYCHNSSPTIKNVILNNNTSYGNYMPSGGGISLSNSNCFIINTLIINNTSLCSGAGLYCWNFSEPEIINCTFVNNSSASSAGAIMCGALSYPVITNSILWNNNPDEIGGYINHVTVIYSDIEGGWTGEGNIDEDPLFVGTGVYPYSLLEDSPCIDAGTSDTTGLNLPEYDLAGNPRIFGDTIDMGAYEWQGTGITNDQLLMTNLHLSTYPNPFNPETKIVFNLPEKGNVKLEIFNMKGQKVKTLIDEVLPAGGYSVFWNGTDSNSNRVSSGIYLYRLQTGSEKLVRKMLLLK